MEVSISPQEKCKFSCLPFSSDWPNRCYALSFRKHTKTKPKPTLKVKKEIDRHAQQNRICCFLSTKSCYLLLHTKPIMQFHVKQFPFLLRTANTLFLSTSLPIWYGRIIHFFLHLAEIILFISHALSRHSLKQNACLFNVLNVTDHFVDVIWLQTHTHFCFYNQ